MHDEINELYMPRYPSNSKGKNNALHKKKGVSRILLLLGRIPSLAQLSHPEYTFDVIYRAFHFNAVLS